MALKLGKGGGGLEGLSLAGKLAVGVLFVLMVGAAYFVVFYGEIESNIASQQQVLDGKLAELETAKADDRAYNKDLTDLERKKLVAVRQKKILPDQAETPSFLSTLQSVATISGIKLVEWAPQDQTPEAFYARVPMKLKLEGKFHQIAKFFNGVGQVDRIINMENITIKIDPAIASRKPDDKGAPQGEDAVNVHVDCLATAFRALQPGEGSTDRKKRRDRKGGK